ncbi:MAG: response regulator transcription factor [Alphaproteobacteria bacterium]|nr:response regulator transcription factor [Alphaproteobacteria bacterium]
MDSLALAPHILVVDDDTRLRALLARYLGEQGFVVSTAKDAGDARAKMKSLSYDLMVLDVMMPGETGFDLTRALRRDDVTARPLPILLLTAKGETDDRIEGLEAGADDYLMKPFEPRELLLRINAILRRAPKTAAKQKATLKFGAWLYDPERDELRSDVEVVALTGMEAGLMRALAATPGQALSREELIERSAAGQDINDRTVDVQVTRLRRKIEADAKNPRYLVTVRGEGYCLRPDAG